MADPRFNGPPEIVAQIFEAGNPASVLANNAVWVTETTNNGVAAGLSSANAVATAAHWQGAGAIASMITSTGLNTGLQTLMGWTAEKIGVTTAAVEAFMLARSTVVPSVVSTTNRFEWVVLAHTNWFGQNTMPMGERDAEYYGHHWPTNSAIGWAYSSTLATLVAALAVPPPLAPMGASPAAPAVAASAVAQAAAQSGMNGAMQAGSQATQGAGQAAAAPAEGGSQLSSMMQQPLQMISGLTGQLQEVVKAPMDAFQGMASMPQGLMQSLTGAFSSAGAGNAGAAGVAAEPAVLAGATSPLGGAAGGGGVGGGGGFPGAGLTSYTRPTSSFEPEAGGRPTSLRAGVLNASELRPPTSPTSSGMGGSPMPMSPAGMLGHGKEGQADKDVTRARVVVGGGEPPDET